MTNLKFYDETANLKYPENQAGLLRIPVGQELKLASGRVLRYQGVKPIKGADRTKPNEALELHTWNCSDGLLVTATMDEVPQSPGVPLLHIAVSYEKRDPGWELLKMVRDVFFPEVVDVMMVLPRRVNYVNIQAHTFHLVQMPRAWGIM